MLRVDVDVVRLETLQRAFDGTADARLAQLPFGHRLPGQGLRPELVRDDNLVARQLFECLADKLLVLEVGIHFRRIKERTAQFECPMHQPYGFLFLWRFAVGVCETHATHADSGDFDVS